VVPDWLNQMPADPEWIATALVALRKGHGQTRMVNYPH